MKKLLYLITPPFLFNYFKSFKSIEKNTSKRKKESLFDGESALFRNLLDNSMVYGEYGVGKSTIFAVEHSNSQIISVDTSKEWINKVDTETLNLPNYKNLKMIHIDVGELEPYGHPKNYLQSNNFSKYFKSIWELEIKPDFVLIDGRFRVACFLTCLKFGNIGTKILFDDYMDRERYHIVEQFEKPIVTNARQALFEISSERNFEMLDSYISKFEYVFD
tara:strand:+ start:24 stop:680 length:657 start_codon:yes stop_codon:yes gene_type:complete